MTAISTFPVLGTAHLTLREMRSDDVDGYAELLTDPEESHFNVDAAVSADEVPAKIARNRAARSEGRSIYWAIEWAGGFAGFVALHGPATEAPALSYAVRRGCRRRGVASEAVGAVLTYAFEVLGAAQVSARTHPENAASALLLAGLGFTDQGRVETAHGTRRQFSLGAPASK